MALPNIMRKLFRNDGYGPLLRTDIVPFTSDLASNAADVASSTKWVKDLYGPAPLYASPDGSSANDGLSSASPVDIVTALEKSAARVHGRQPIHLAGGTYDVPILVAFQHVEFILDGTATFNKGIAVDNGTLTISRSSDTYTFTVNNYNTHAIFIDNHSGFYAAIPFYANVNDEFSCIRVINNSRAWISPSTIIFGSNASGVGIAVRSNSFCSLAGDLTFSGSSAKHLIEIENNAVFHSDYNINGSNITTTSSAVAVIHGSVFLFDDSNKTLNVKSSGYGTISVSINSACTIDGTVTLTNTGNNVGWLSSALYVERASLCSINGSLYLKNTQKTGALLCVTGQSVVQFLGTLVDFRGSTVATGTVVVRENSTCMRNSTVTVSGAITSGKKYDVHDSSSLYFGTALNSIPGSGTSVESSSYSVVQ